MSVQDTMLWRCKACSTETLGADLLQAPSPFDPLDGLTACPQCKQCDQGFDLVCDEPGCKQIGNCGWPTPDGGYRHTCNKHMRNEP